MLLSLFKMMYGRIYTASALKLYAETDKEIQYTFAEYMAKMMSKLNALRTLCFTGTCEAETKVGSGDWVLISWSNLEFSLTVFLCRGETSLRAFSFDIIFAMYSESVYSISLSVLANGLRV